MDADDLFSVVDDDTTPPARADAVTSDAPYGYKSDGTPYKRRPSGNAGPRKQRAAKKDDASTAVTTAVMSMWGAVVALLTVFARMLKSTPLMADAIVVSKSTPKVVPPLTKVIAQNERLVEMCVRLSTITPGIEFAMALMPLIGQILTNHDMVPGSENQSERIVKAYEKEMAEAHAQEQADLEKEREFYARTG